VQLWFIISRLVGVAAILSLLAVQTVTPSLASAAIAPMASIEGASMAPMTEEMPCPGQEPYKPDCQKSCPLAALCFAKCIPGIPTAAAALSPIVAIAILTMSSDIEHDALAQAPPPRPPRT
jgi:hypothetical protein